jgi:signal transduction histidine kinase/CheY-like chemotaxis protein
LLFTGTMDGASNLPQRDLDQDFQYPTKFRQAVFFHLLGIGLIASNGTIGWLFGYGAQAIACTITPILLGLNLLHALFRPRSYNSFASIGLGLAVLHVSFMGAMMPELPIVLGYFVFSPILAVVLIGERHIKRWSYLTIAAVLLMIGLSQTGLPHIWHGHMSAPQIFFITMFTLASMMTLATMTIVILLEDHREHAARMLHQQLWLEVMNEKLVLLQSSKERFFATASHELRTPMNAIAGIAELLRSSRQDKAEVDNLLTGLHNSSRHLLSIINDLLDLGKLRENKLQLSIGDFDVRDAITTAFGIARDAQLSKNAAVKMTMTLAPGLPQFLRGDSRRLTQVLLNLLNNATKFTRDGEISLRVRVAAATEPNSCRFSIKLSDTGIGMSSTTQRTLFDDYVQANESIASLYGGTGLGLSITKRLVDLMAGKIEVTSELGRGSIFKVDIEMPLGTAPPKVEIAAPTTDVAAGKRILIVDDNHLNVVIAQKLIERKFPGIIIDSAQNGQLAVDKVLVNFYDLIFMDMQMPVLNGVEATKQIRLLRDSRQALVPIVAMTANTEEADFAACLDAGMNQTMSKPVSAGALAAAVQEFLFLDPTKSSMNIRPANSGDFYVPVGGALGTS